MASPRLPRHLAVAAALLSALAVALPDPDTNSTAAVDKGPKGNCSCGGFPTATPDATQQPLLAQTPGLVVPCSAEGNATCRNLCTALATATKAKGPEILCKRIVNCDELKLSAFYKICEEPWAYANMTAEEPLCCAGGAARPCAGAALPLVDATAPL